MSEPIFVSITYLSGACRLVGRIDNFLPCVVLTFNLGLTWHLHSFPYKLTFLYILSLYLYVPYSPMLF